MPHRILKKIVGDRKLVQVTLEASVFDACEIMKTHHVTAVLIVNEGSEGAVAEGIFTKRDLLRRVVVAGHDPKATPITDVMTRELFVIDADQSGFEAVRVMRDENIRHMVVSNLERGYGVISLRDILGQELAAFEKELDFEKKVWEEI